MIEPPPDSIMAGIAYLHPRKTPLRLMSMTRSHVRSEVSVTEPSSAGKIPALLYRIVREPNRSMAVCTAASTSPDSDTSVWT